MPFQKKDQREKNKNRKCSECLHAHKVDDITYECDAEKYDINEKTCFVQKED